MKTQEYLRMLQEEIHSTAFATIGADGHPEVRTIDIMLHDEESVYFITAKGKNFYHQLLEQQFVAVSGTKHDKAISLRGQVRQADPALLGQVFEQNPYMQDIYPQETRDALEVFQIFEGQGEYFDLSVRPIFRDTFTLGQSAARESGYRITDRCIGCQLCYRGCPQKCIRPGQPFQIQQQHCLHCGRCQETCPAQAIIRI